MDFTLPRSSLSGAASASESDLSLLSASKWLIHHFSRETRLMWLAELEISSERFLEVG